MRRLDGLLAFLLSLGASMSRADAAAIAAMPGPVEIHDASESDYFEGHAEGWFWYHDPKLLAALRARESAPASPSSGTPSDALRSVDDPVAAVARQKQELEEAMDRAVIDPSPSNMEAYLTLNARLLAQSATFAESWKSVVYTHPELDYRQTSPVGNAAYVRAEVERADDDRRLGAAAGEWGLLFFFRGECPYCHQFAPLLKTFAERFGFHVVDVTLDGGALPEFPHPQVNGDAGKSLGVNAVPAVFLINARTRQVAPAAYGLLGWSELSERILHALDQLGHGPDGMTPQIAAKGDER